MGRQFPFNVRVDGRYGAPMGRADDGQGHDEYVKVRHRMVLLSEGYDGGGAYWGSRERGTSLFCLWTPDRSFVRYVDAPSYLVAQEIVRGEMTNADFL